MTEQQSRYLFQLCLPAPNSKKDIQAEIWQEFLCSLDNLSKEMSADLQRTEVYKQAKVLREQPMPFHMFYFVSLAAPILFRMNCAIYKVKGKPAFITSDNPCLWVDPAVLYPVNLFLFSV